eukprot:XP_788345.3 PREDICTED: transmembrane emp24 domain-containing protein 3 [Strongylocentrotus purpuratus]
MYKCTCATLLKWFHIELLIIFEKCGYLRRELDDFRQDLKAFSSFHSYVCSSLHRGTQPYNFKMCEITLFLSIFVALCLLAVSQAVELTFELPDNANQCFHEDVEKDVKIILEYQVVTGGQYDVDALVKSPSGTVVYKEKRKQYDTFTWTTDQAGTIEFCFSNEFSTFAHKVVYFDFMAGDEDPLIRDIGAHATALGQLETSCVTIHEALKAVVNFQTHYRLREGKGRGQAERLNKRVHLWSLGEFFLILVIGIGQVIVLRSFFTDKKNKTGRA